MNTRPNNDEILDTGFPEKENPEPIALEELLEQQKQGRASLIWAIILGLIATGFIVAYFHYRRVDEVMEALGSYSWGSGTLAAEYNTLGIAGLIAATCSVVQFYIAFMYWVKYLGHKKNQSHS